MINQRLIIIVIDGLGIDYYNYMTKLQDMGKRGFYKQVKALMPTVTNINNVSICCGAWPNEHGIFANSYYDENSGSAVYMNSSNLIRYPTLFQKAKGLNLKSILLSAKRKTLELFDNQPTFAISAENAPDEIINRYGNPPDIYSSEVNYWIWKCAIDSLKHRKDINLYYIHTTDYPMHRWSPSQKESQDYLFKLDSLIEEAKEIAPDAAIFVTADHGMNQKIRCWDIMKACKKRGLNSRFVLSPERDYYIVHHRNFAGSCWVWLEKEYDIKKAFDILYSLDGIEEIITKKEAIERYKLPENHIGDLMLLGDKNTVFGELDSELEYLPKDYRAHGSIYESDVPLIVYGYDKEIPFRDYFTHNLHLTSFLF